MAAQAKIDKWYVRKVGILAAMFLGISLWFLYDGFVAYPKQKLVFDEFEKFKQSNVPPAKMEERWNQYAKEKNFPLFNDGKPGKNHSDLDIYTQRVLGFILLPLGLLFAWGTVRLVGRWISSNEEGLTTSWGQSALFSQITLFNKDRWKSKGIAVVYYQADGKKRRLVLDDWKYDRKATQIIVDEVQSRLQPDQIVGEPPVITSEPAADQAAKDTQAKQ